MAQKLIPFEQVAELRGASQPAASIDKREALALLLSSGHSAKTAAAQIGVEESLVLGLMNSAVFQARVTQLRALADSTGKTPDEILEDEFIPTINTLIHLRDHAVSETVRLAAANKLHDISPRGRRKSVEDDVRKFVLSAEALLAMKAAMSEGMSKASPAIETTFTEVGPESVHQVVPKQPA